MCAEKAVTDSREESNAGIGTGSGSMLDLVLSSFDMVFRCADRLELEVLEMELMDELAE